MTNALINATGLPNCSAAWMPATPKDVRENIAAAKTKVPASQMIRHLDHLIGIMGEEGVALGSDFDGTTVPDWMESAADLPRLVAGMQAAGYGPALIERLCWGNWMGLLRRVIG